tara:strand:- start:2464 stop:5139 length:2676 start_codon:yes stop_codon:yes gene_type:complete
MKKLLIEGPVGHMWHPFDLDKVKTGRDLLSVFENEVVEYINNFTPSIKIDGINGPIRLIDNDEGEKEFAIDRMSTAPLDVRGVTADRLRERFEKAILMLVPGGTEVKVPLHKLVAMGIDINTLEVGKKLEIVYRKKKTIAIVKELTSGHGFVNDGSVALKVLNAALAADLGGVRNAMQELGMWDNPSICLNNDIVHESSKESGMVNAVSYQEDFIAFHGLNEIFTPEGKKARKTREISMSDSQKRALIDLVRIANHNNPVEGFRVLSPFDAVATKGDSPIDFSPALSAEVTIELDNENAVSKTIGAWLSDSKIVKPSYTEKYTFSDGKTRSYFSKANYVALIPDSGEQRASVRDMLSVEAHPEITEDDYYKFASSAIFYHATRLLGREVLKTLVNKSQIGNEALTSHEGVVMRSERIFGTDDKGKVIPVKITGDFIRTGMFGGIAKKIVKEAVEMDDAPPGEIGDEEHEEVVVNTQGTKTVAIMPGSFKPPHKGHLQMAEALSKLADEVFIFVSAPVGSKRLLPFSKTEISYQKAMDLWKILLTNSSPNIELKYSDFPSYSPITALEDLLTPVEQRKHYKDVDFFPEDYAKFILGMSEKEKDDEKAISRFEMYKDNPKVEIVFLPAFNHSPEYATEVSKLGASNAELLMALERDVEVMALEIAKGLVSKRKVSKLPANPTIKDYIGALSKANQISVAKFMKSTPKELDKSVYSATDLRLLLDLKGVYELPVDELLKDFIGNNIDAYMEIVGINGKVQESKIVVKNMILSILLERIDEMSASSGVGGGSIEGGARANRDEDEDDESPNKAMEEANLNPTDLPQEPSLRSMSMDITPDPKAKITGVASDAGYKKYINNKHNFDKTNKRKPYYDKEDLIKTLVEKVLRNIIRSN